MEWPCLQQVLHWFGMRPIAGSLWVFQTWKKCYIDSPKIQYREHFSWRELDILDHDDLRGCICNNYVCWTSWDIRTNASSAKGCILGNGLQLLMVYFMAGTASTSTWPSEKQQPLRCTRKTRLDLEKRHLPDIIQTLAHASCWTNLGDVLCVAHL